MTAYRHGDILIRRVDAVPTEGVKLTGKDKRGLVLAEGEVTGHAHTIARPSAGQQILVSATEANELRMWLTLDTPAELTHQEHSTITLPAGDYEVIRQVEYEAGELRNVAD